MGQELEKGKFRAWMERWERIAEVERQELRSATVLTKLRQLAAAIRLGRSLGLQNTTEDDLPAVHALWMRLKNAHANKR